MVTISSYKNAGELKIRGIRSLEVGSLFKKNRQGGKTFVLLHQDDDGDIGIGYAEWGISDDGDYGPRGKHRIMRQGQPVLFIDVPPVAVDGDYGLVTSGHGTARRVSVGMIQAFAQRQGSWGCEECGRVYLPGEIKDNNACAAGRCTG